jgi:hypothetical protein
MRLSHEDAKRCDNLDVVGFDAAAPGIMSQFASGSAP